MSDEKDLTTTLGPIVRGRGGRRRFVSGTDGHPSHSLSPSSVRTSTSSFNLQEHTLPRMENGFGVGSIRQNSGRNSQRSHSRHVSTTGNIFGSRRQRRFIELEDNVSVSAAEARTYDETQKQQELEAECAIRGLGRQMSRSIHTKVKKAHVEPEPNRSGYPPPRRRGSSTASMLASSQRAPAMSRSWTSSSHLPPNTNASSAPTKEISSQASIAPNLALNSQKKTQDYITPEVEPEIMIGEIQNVNVRKELNTLRSALLMVVVVLVTAFAAKENVDIPGDDHSEVDVYKWVLFAIVTFVSLPVLRFTARLFAYILTTKASGMLYKGNRYYFPMVLHNEIALVCHGVVLVLMWNYVFEIWVLDLDESLAEKYGIDNCHEIAANILESYLAFRVGLLVKNFIVLYVATTYLWRPYLQRVKSSILAQYLLLLLTDYCTKGTLNPDDERFAIQMGQQGTQWRNVSLYAISKAMGFIPRNKLGHAFFKEIGGSDTLDSRDDAAALGNFLFTRLLECSKASAKAKAAASKEVTQSSSSGDLTNAWHTGYSAGNTGLTSRPSTDESKPQSASHLSGVNLGNGGTTGRASVKGIQLKGTLAAAFEDGFAAVSNIFGNGGGEDDKVTLEGGTGTEVEDWR
ncbi:unnamed protein product, partial [Choristocarpus tenellus]